MEYVNSALDKWLLGQYDLGELENNPARQTLRMRIASTAFHCAIIWHMLYGEPDYRKRAARDAVVSLTIYAANYFMERWLHKYGRQHNQQQAKFTADELVKIRRVPAPEQLDNNLPSDLPEDSIEKGKFFAELNTSGKSYNEIGREYNLNKDQVSGFIRRYRKSLESQSCADKD